MLTKSAKYYWDQDAVRESFADKRMGNPGGGGNYAKNCPYPNGRQNQQSGLQKGEWNEDGSVLGRNLRSVWNFATHSYKGAHFATFPPELPRRCILAASRPGDTILDPFAGSGTTLAVAQELGREFVGIELAEEYLPLIKARLAKGQKPMAELII